MQFPEQFKWSLTKEEWNSLGHFTGKMLAYDQICSSLTNEITFFSDLYNWEEYRETALETFKKNKNSMMKVAVQGLEKDLKITS